MSNDNDSIIQDVIEYKIKQEPHKKKDFMPWHKPRKQFIRRFQWGKEIEDLISKLEFRDNRPFRYLTLPGEDLLDIRSLHEIFSSHDLKLKYLGFKISESGKTSTETDISKNEVSKLSHIHRDSDIVPDEIQMIAERNSKAYQSAKLHGEFDTINIDLCNCITTRGRSQIKHFDVLLKLLNIQLSRTEPWLLFITTQAGPYDVVNYKDTATILGLVKENSVKHRTFKTKLEGLFDGDIQLFDLFINFMKGGKLPNRLTSREETAFTKVFGVGIGKWLLRVNMSGQPHCRIKVLSVYSYRIRSRAPTMLSIAFMFDPILRPITDNTGLTERPHQRQSPAINEERLACDIIDSAISCEDLDRKMNSDSRVNEDMIEETKNLLKQARYDVDGDEYERWLLDNKPRI